MTTQIFTVMKKYRFRWEAEEFELTKKDLTLFTKNVRRGKTKKRDKNNVGRTFRNTNLSEKTIRKR